MQKYLVNMPFTGFYESALDHMIDQEIENIFSDENGNHLNTPDAVYFNVDFSDVHRSQAKHYLAAWCDAFEDETGIKLNQEYESYTSPKYYNFETDRLFCHMPVETINALFTASENDNHTQLAKVIKERFTSRSGFISSYSNNLGDWLKKPVLTWDHNELGTLVLAVLAIHCPKYDDAYGFETYTLMENYQCNGNLSNDVWSVLTEELRNFAELQREYGKPVDYDLWLETGKAYPEGTTREELEETGELPLPRCPHTLELF